MAEKCLDSEWALHISGHVYHQQSNVTCDRDVGVSFPSQSALNSVERLSPFTPTDSSLSILILSRLQEEPVRRRSPTTSFVGCHLCVLPAPPPHPPLSDRRRCLAEILQRAWGAEVLKEFETTEIT